MASRQEKKEERRRERLERERKEAAAVARLKRLQLAGGGLLGLAVLAAATVAVAAGLGGGGDTGDKAPSSAASSSVKLPTQQTSDYEAAAKAAGCELPNPAFEDAGHEEKDFKASDYKTNPPTSGTHFPEWYDDGVYEPGTTPNLGKLVHTLEHGRIDVQYKRGTPKGTVEELEALVAEQNEAYHMLLFENTTDMPYAVAATAWTHLLGCPTMNNKVFDALRTFRARYIDKGLENAP